MIFILLWPLSYQQLKEQNSIRAFTMHNFLMELYHKTDKGTKSIIDIEEKAIYRAKYVLVYQQKC